MKVQQNHICIPFDDSKFIQYFLNVVLRLFSNKFRDWIVIFKDISNFAVRIYFKNENWLNI